MALATQSVQVRPVDDMFVCCVPVSTDQGCAVAVAELSSAAPQLARLLQWTLARAMHSENARPANSWWSDNAHNHHEEPVTVRMEWLALLPGQVVPEETDRPVHHVAEKILPQLCRLIQASCLTWIQDGRQLITVGSMVTSAHWSTGEVNVPDRRIRELLHRFSAEAIEQNGICCRARNLQVAGVEDPEGIGLILVPVRMPGPGSGWLIAVSTQPSETHASFELAELCLVRGAATVLASRQRIVQLFQDQEHTLTGVVRALVNALDAKDTYTCGHSDRVAEFARLIALEMGLSDEESEQIHMTGLLHDIGKVGMPDDVLNKAGELTNEELEQIRRHPVTGYEILSHLNSFDYVLPGVLHHHEAMDGTGYPHGLRGDSIPLSARILAVADAWDAMTSSRPYRVGMSTEHATAILRDGSGRQWDSDCVDAFFRCIDGIRLSTDWPHTGVAAPKMVRRAAVSAMMRRSPSR